MEDSGSIPPPQFRVAHRSKQMDSYTDPSTEGSRYPYFPDTPDRLDSLAPRVLVDDSGTVPGTDALVSAAADSELVACTPFMRMLPPGLASTDRHH